MEGRMLTAEEIVNLFWSLVTFGVLLSLWFGWPSIQPWLITLIQRYVAIKRDAPTPETANEEATPPDNNNHNNLQNAIATLQNERNELLLLAKAQTLARFIHAKKITQTDGIKLVFGVGPSSSNKVYIAAREAVQAELARLASLDTETPEQAEARLRAMVAASRQSPE